MCRHPFLPNLGDQLCKAAGADRSSGSLGSSLPGAKSRQPAGGSLKIQHWEEGLGEGWKVEYGTAKPASGLRESSAENLLTLLYLPPHSSFTLSDFRLFRSQPSLLVFRPSVLSAKNPGASGQPGSVGEAFAKTLLGGGRSAVNWGRGCVGFGKKYRFPRPGPTPKSLSSILLEHQRS